MEFPVEIDSDNIEEIFRKEMRTVGMKTIIKVLIISSKYNKDLKDYDRLLDEKKTYFVTKLLG